MDQELKSINVLLQQLVSNQAVHSAEQRNLKDEVSVIKNVLIGTGSSQALTVRVAISENELARLKEERQDRKLPKAAWLGITVSCLLGITSFILKFI